MSATKRVSRKATAERLRQDLRGSTARENARGRAHRHREVTKLPEPGAVSAAIEGIEGVLEISDEEESGVQSNEA